MPTEVALWVLVAVVVVAAVVLRPLIRPRLRPLGRDTRFAYLLLRHPEPIASWVRLSNGSFDRGLLWIDDDPDRAIEVLERNWDVVDGATLRAFVEERLAEGPLSAWNGMRAIRLATMGACCGYVSEEETWSIARRAASRLAERYGSFEEALDDYLVDYAKDVRVFDEGCARDAHANLRVAKKTGARVPFRLPEGPDRPSTLPPEAARRLDL